MAFPTCHCPTLEKRAHHFAVRDSPPIFLCLKYRIISALFPFLILPHFPALLRHLFIFPKPSFPPVHMCTHVFALLCAHKPITPKTVAIPITTILFLFEPTNFQEFFPHPTNLVINIVSCIC